MRIVGVMPDVGYGQVGRVTEPTQLHLYLPYARSASRAMAFVVRASGEPASLREQVRRTLRQVRAGIPVFDVRTIRESRREASLDQEFVGIVMGALAAMSLLLASLGVYGLVADSARQREREMAIRLVLGATPSTIIWLLLNQARRSGIAGVVLGLALAIAVAGALRGSLIAVRVFEPIDVPECGRDSARRRPGRGVPAGATRVSHRSRRDPASELSESHRLAHASSGGSGRTGPCPA